jgi:hypothetical protein
LRRAGVACAVLVAAGAGCSSVLGLDAPTLDPCTTGTVCLDATADVTVDASDAAAMGDATDAGSMEAAPEAAPDAAQCVWDGAVPDASTPGIRCGGGCEPVTYCTGETPVCCQTTATSGEPVFACTSEAACTGYAILCVNENDCSGSEVCCHYLAHMICDTACTSNEVIACIPGSPDDCPTGKACDVRVSDGEGDAAVPVPYYVCAF